MRKFRAVIFDDDEAAGSELKGFFLARGYEVLMFRGPSVICPRHWRHTVDCANAVPCADIMVSDLHLPGPSGIERFTLQGLRGCPIESRSKAITADSIDPASEGHARDMGVTIFPKPVALDSFSAWAEGNEQRTDRSCPLATSRREERIDCLEKLMVCFPGSGTVLSAVAVNSSRTGLCLRMPGMLPLAETVSVMSGTLCGRHQASIRWVQRSDGGTCLSGLQYC